MRFGMGYDAWTGGGHGFGGHGSAGHGRHGHRHGHDGEEGGRRGGGRGRRRVFDGGELRLVLLKLIADAPRHGYDLIREIESLSGGAYAPSPGVVYPTLTLLQDMGLIGEQASGGAKKQFAVTAAGAAEVAEKADEITALFARLSAMAEVRERTDGAPIRRAMMNLRTVLQHRLSAGDADKEMLHQVADLLDEAARKIERL